jgi:glycosyltransferase involved in cell wall biosynthesis
MTAKPRKILLVTYGRPFGGAEIYTGRLAQLLGDDATFYALCGNAHLGSYLSGSGVEVFSYDPRLRKGIWWKLEYFLICAVMLPYLRWRYSVDTIWIQGFREAFFLPLARLFGYTAIATMHITLERSISQVFYPYLILSAHRVLCVSESVAESLPSIVPRSKIAVIQNWVSSPQKKCAVGQHPACGRLRLLYVGRLVQYKGVSLILEAMRQLKEAGYRYEVSLTIVGDGNYRQELECQAKGLDVQFLGFIEDTSAAYQSAEIFVSPTYGPEGSSLVALEAMAHGLPCILSDIGVNRELTEGGKYALLFRRGDAADLRAKIEMCITCPELMQQYKRVALNIANTKHGPKVAHARYVEELGM